MAPVRPLCRLLVAVSWFGCGASFGCGGAPASAPQTPTPEPPRDSGAVDSGAVDSGAEAQAPGNDPRALGPTATFADVVAAARLLDDRSAADSTEGCLFRGDAAPGSAFRVEADVAVAVRPLSDPAPNLLPRLRRAAGAVAVLSRWGRAGPDGGTMAFSTFTSAAPPEGPSIVLAITEAGVLLRSTEGAVPTGHEGPFPAADVAAHLAAAAPSNAGMLVVTASPTTPLPGLRAILLSLPPRLAARVALGVVLAADTTLPAGPRPPAAVDDGLCDDGLPEPAAEQVETSPDASAVLGALASFRENAAACVSAAGAGAARGGRLEILLRAGAGGAVEAACAHRDTVGDAALRACVLGSARSARLPAPTDERGFYDVALPLLFAADDSLRQAPWCPASR